MDFLDSLYSIGYAITSFFSFIQMLMIMLVVFAVIWIVLYILRLISGWKAFKKMGKPGWVGLAPWFISDFVLYDSLYGNGYRLLFNFVPIYNIYVTLKQKIDLAKGFGKGTAFGVLWWIFPWIMYMIIGFGGSTYSGEDKTRGVWFWLEDVIAKAIKKSKS